MKSTIILDLDGVMITTPSWKQGEILKDGFDSFNEYAVNNLNSLLDSFDVSLWLISDRRKSYTMEQFNLFLENRKVKGQLVGMVPVYGNVSRKEELERFIEETGIVDFVIIDDDSSIASSRFKTQWVRTSPLIGFNKDNLNDCIKILTYEK